MTKKYTITIFTFIFFTALNFAPLLMINCTETDGSSHLENIFNQCCSSSMLEVNNMPGAVKSGISFSDSHCLCSTEYANQVYLLPKYDTNYSPTITSLIDINEENLHSSKNIISTYISESPPISISQVKTTVFLI